MSTLQVHKYCTSFRLIYPIYHIKSIFWPISLQEAVINWLGNGTYIHYEASLLYMASLVLRQLSGNRGHWLGEFVRFLNQIVDTGMILDHKYTCLKVDNIDYTKSNCSHGSFTHVACSGTHTQV